MKAKNSNSSSAKTKKAIKKTFAEMLGEKREVGKISVSELCARAELSRGAFYSHYDDIYGVAEDYENELIDKFFDSAQLLKSENSGQFIDVVFRFIRENDENYRLLCKSNDFLLTAKRLTAIASDKLLEIYGVDRNDEKDGRRISLEINVFLDGLLCEYVKACRGYTDTSLEELYDYTKAWNGEFLKKIKDGEKI